MAITAQSLAEAADVTEAYARMILAGKRRPSLGVALRVFDALGEQIGPLSGLETPEIEAARKMAQAA